MNSTAFINKPGVTCATALKIKFMALKSAGREKKKTLQPKVLEPTPMEGPQSEDHTDALANARML